MMRMMRANVETPNTFPCPAAFVSLWRLPSPLAMTHAVLAATQAAAAALRKKRQAAELGLISSPPKRVGAGQPDRRRLCHQAVYDAIETNAIPAGVTADPLVQWIPGAKIGAQR